MLYPIELRVRKGAREKAGIQVEAQARKLRDFRPGITPTNAAHRNQKSGFKIRNWPTSPVRNPECAIRIAHGIHGTLGIQRRENSFIFPAREAPRAPFLAHAGGRSLLDFSRFSWPLLSSHTAPGCMKIENRDSIIENPFNPHSAILTATVESDTRPPLCS
jgi:hypothetical protein